MGLKFYFGGSGAGKSTRVYQDMIDWSVREPQRKFAVLVPDQFTMQTQKELVCMHPDCGIMNIDVLSFGRLTHRILEEVGGENIPVLDDTGKNLVLRKVAGMQKDNMPVIGANLNRTGYIHEVKSVISEFMQYGISPEQVGEMAKQSQKRGVLCAKLTDLQLLYHSFLEYIDKQFITSEESLDLLCHSLHKSKWIRDSVIVFDGFTGFTPVQNRVIQEMLTLCKQVCVTVMIDPNEKPYLLDGEQKLFHLSKKTVNSLCKLCEQAGAERENDIILPSAPVLRYQNNPCFDYLEQNLFRYGKAPYEEEQDAIAIYQMENPVNEVRFVCHRIRELIRTENLQYRDIAVVTGDLNGYADLLKDEFRTYEIPCFADQTAGILLNPFVEYIRSAIQVLLKQYSYESVFHYLRSGMTGISMEEVDLLENYVRALGIRGRKNYENLFTRHTQETANDAEKLQRLNEIRERFVSSLSILHQPAQTMTERVNLLYDFIVQAGIEEQLGQYEKMFAQEGNAVREKEYAQIYRMVMQLLEQMVGLLGEELLSWKEFYEILDAGLSEIQVGAIPQNVDRVVCGDIERTRLNEVKVLFFIGVNDGIIPANGGSGGMISDLDREFLHQAEWELAPTPRQKMYTQRLYLYMNLTKPTRHLYITYASVGSDGKPAKPAYLIQTIRKMYPKLSVQYGFHAQELEYAQSAQDAVRIFVPMLRDYAAGLYDHQEKKEKQVMFLYHMLRENEKEREQVDELIRTAFYRYRNTPLGKKVAEALYGTVLNNSVSRMECFAQCQYKHFLEYGLQLAERENFEITSRDMGTLYHELLSRFSEGLERRGLSFASFSAQEGEEILGEAIRSYTAEFEKSILYSSARNEYVIHILRQVMGRTIETLQYQLKKGIFSPKGFELSFQTMEDLGSVNFNLSGEEKVRLKGRIDRLDLCEDDEHVYVKVIDYKSGKKDFDLISVYHGLTLQLVLYMNVAMEREAKLHPDKKIVPAGLLYYRLDDPIVDREEDMEDESINQAIHKELRMAGIVNADADVVAKMDGSIAEGGRSDTIPVQVKTDGNLSATSHAYSEDILTTISSYVNWKIRDLSREILQGKIEKNPYEYGEQHACEYCRYQEVCGFDRAQDGYEYHRIEETDEQEILDKMRETDEQEIPGKMRETDEQEKLRIVRETGNV